MTQAAETGVFSSHPFETRQFVSACRIATAYCGLALLINVVENLYVPLVSLLVGLITLLEVMRWSALRSGLTAQLQWAFATFTSVGLAVAWFLNGGMNGSIPMVYLLALFLALSISDEYRLHFLGLYSLSAIFCLFVEITQPEWVIPYSNARIQFLDSAVGLLTAMLALGYGTHNFKASYDRQRSRVQRKNEEVSAAYSELQYSNCKLQQLMRTNSEHLHIIAHDLRNPVGAVIGLVEVCREEYELDENLAKDLATMEQAAHQALGLIQQLSEVAYLEERKVVLQPAPNRLAPLLERTIRKLDPLARKKHQILAPMLDENLEANVDSGRFSSVVDNLVENAIKYSALDSQIEIRLERRGENAVVRVRDEGPGIPDEQRGKLFTMFGKVGTRPTGRESSTGLGLYIAKMLTDLHGGKLEQENLPEKGSEFRLIIPALPASAGSSPSRSTEEASAV